MEFEENERKTKMRVKVTNDCGFKLDIKVNGKLDRASWKLIFDLANDNTIDKTRIDSELRPYSNSEF